MSEKRLVRARGQALRSPNTGLTGPRRAVHYPALHLRTGYFFSGRSWDYINIRSPHNAQFLSTYRTVRLHNSFTCMGNRIDYFSSGSSMEPHRFLFDLFAFTIRSPAWEIASIIFRAGARWNRTDFCSICLPSQFVHLHGKPYRLFSSGSTMEPHRFLFDLFAFTICSPA